MRLLVPYTATSKKPLERPAWAIFPDAVGRHDIIKTLAEAAQKTDLNANPFLVGGHPRALRRPMGVGGLRRIRLASGQT